MEMIASHFASKLSREGDERIHNTIVTMELEANLRKFATLVNTRIGFEVRLRGAGSSPLQLPSSGVTKLSDSGVPYLEIKRLLDADCKRYSLRIDPIARPAGVDLRVARYRQIGASAWVVDNTAMETNGNRWAFFTGDLEAAVEVFLVLLRPMILG